MGISEAALAAYAALASTAVAAYSADQNSKNQKASLQQQKTAADAQLKQADRATNKANGKTPDIGAMLTGAEAASKGGQGGTLLTGPGGVDPNQLTLGRTTLLGGS